MPPTWRRASPHLAEQVADPIADDDLQLGPLPLLRAALPLLPGGRRRLGVAPGARSRSAACSRKRSSPPSSARSAAASRSIPRAVGELLFRLESEDEGASLSRHLEIEAGIEEFREFVVHRSLYQLKEADPTAGRSRACAARAKAALLEVQYDEYGGGRPERMHSTLFAKTMRALGLEDARERLPRSLIPGTTLATVNLMSAVGLRRGRRGAIVGHLAMFEMTSAQPNRRYGNGLRRLGFDAEATDFFDEHVEADAVHENIAAYDLAGGLARQEPELAADIVFGARALLFLEDRFARRLLDRWERGETSLLRPL